eukprot:169418-Lingulodinium_polyedra.AAC.1
MGSIDSTGETHTQRVTHNTQYATHNAQRTTHNAQRTPALTPNAPVPYYALNVIARHHVP